MVRMSVTKSLRNYYYYIQLLLLSRFHYDKISPGFLMCSKWSSTFSCWINKWYIVYWGDRHTFSLEGLAHPGMATKIILTWLGFLGLRLLSSVNSVFFCVPSWCQGKCLWFLFMFLYCKHLSHRIISPGCTLCPVFFLHLYFLWNLCRNMPLLKKS